MKHLIATTLLAVVPLALSAQAPNAGQPSVASRTAPTAEAARTVTAPQMDGRLDDAAWAQAQVIRTFTQIDPLEGQPASEATEVRIVYDDQAIYVGARLHDRSPVTTRLVAVAGMPAMTVPSLTTIS